MTKIKKWKSIFYHNMDEYPTWKNIKDLQFEDDDRIRISYEDPYESSYGGWNIEVEREMEETDEEHERRMETKRWTGEILKKQRYENYLRLKKEFENE
jgi:hypothetical protein